MRSHKSNTFLQNSMIYNIKMFFLFNTMVKLDCEAIIDVLLEGHSLKLWAVEAGNSWSEHKPLHSIRQITFSTICLCIIPTGTSEGHLLRKAFRQAKWFAGFSTRTGRVALSCISIGSRFQRLDSRSCKICKIHTPAISVEPFYSHWLVLVYFSFINSRSIQVFHKLKC